VALLNALFAVINLFIARTASLSGGHIGLMTLTAGGQIEAIAWNTSQGFSSALSAFVAQNYAAKKRQRLNAAYHTTLMMTSILGIFCTILFVFFGSEVFSLIVPTREAYLSGGVFLRIVGYSMWFMMLEITMQGLFYGTGRTLPPAFISITFNLLRIPLAIFLAGATLGIEGVWWAISITSILKGIVAFGWFRLLRNRLFK
ncbi:MAG: MATE family efflux transporter, partial [Massilibacteroides sp.]|nr:MATE family efflux transporter [Massilibacteroides sp.]